MFLDNVPVGEEDRLLDIETQIAATATHNSYMLEVWKSQAQVAWLRGDSQRAFEVVEATIKSALEQNDRLLYNLYFEKAEFLRLSGCPKGGLAYYRKVLRFGEGNGDRNLISNALLGIILADLAAGQWLHYDSEERARDACLRAWQVARDADIQITRQMAERVTVMLDDRADAKPEQLGSSCSRACWGDIELR